MENLQHSNGCDNLRLNHSGGKELGAEELPPPRLSLGTVTVVDIKHLNSLEIEDVELAPLRIRTAGARAMTQEEDHPEVGECCTLEKGACPLLTDKRQ